MRLIDADTLYKFHESSYDGEDLSEFSKGWNWCIKHLAKCTPTIDAAPVVHARWEDECDGYRNCSACGCEHPIRDARGYLVDDEYCPACGAKMDGGACNAAD